jgi:alkanesulfonate monooxygenase SsuD/methylene tetrahydromethanopterin reductase-like flavin-dependent oxidoreductase (luciferase family)
MALGIIGGDTRRFAPVADLYRTTGIAHGHDPAALRVSINSHGYIAASQRQAVDDTYPYFAMAMQNFLGRPASALPDRRQYEAEMFLEGALVAGTPEQVAEKIVYQHDLFHHDRFLMQISLGTMPHRDVMRSIELLGTEVASLVHRAIDARTSGLVSA